MGGGVQVRKEEDRTSFFLFFLTLQHCIGFAIYQHESTTGIHILMHELRHILGFVVIHDSRSLKQEMPESLFHIIHEIPLNLGSVFLC